MNFDRVGFFQRARASVFRGLMEQAQVDGVNHILDAFAAAYFCSLTFLIGCGVAAALIAVWHIFAFDWKG